MIKLERIEQANEILKVINPESKIWLSSSNNQLYINTKRRKHVANISSDGRWFVFDYCHLDMGGTRTNAAVQLVRYVRDFHRYPLRCWRWWNSETIGMARQVDLVTLIQEVAPEYADDKRTGCVLCGSTEYKEGVDWWWGKAMIYPTGPACWHIACTPYDDRKFKKGKEPKRWR